MTRMLAGAHAVDISPRDSQFLAGYPHVERWSTGVHDPLPASALCLDDGRTRLLWIACDILYIPKALAARARRRLEAATGIPAAAILTGATHTHSGPRVLESPATSRDATLPSLDPAYLQLLEDGIVAAGTGAVEALEPASVGIGRTRVEGLGTNRRDPAGPADPDVTLLLAQGANGPLAVVEVLAMHPTVLHEDSTLVSGDFPGLARLALQKRLGCRCPVLHFTGTAGNQSPRHVVKANTFAEAERLGELLAAKVADALPGLALHESLPLHVSGTAIELPRRRFPAVHEAEAKERAARERFDYLRANGTRQAARTAECDWFGAEESLTLATLAADGKLDAACAGVMPAEIQCFRVGDWQWVAWQGESFVEFSLAVKESFPQATVIAYANGELLGYLVTAEAVEEGGYEASNALFASPESGNLLVKASLDLLAAQA